MNTSKINVKDVSKFYGEILGVKNISVSVESGITALVGPSGSGKSTLMNLVAGLLRPTEGEVSVLGQTPGKSKELYSKIGYCSQYDSFPKGFTGYQFVLYFLLLHGYSKKNAHELTLQSIDKVEMNVAMDKRIDGYSKGMRQRIKLAQSLAHDPEILILDEPLNGLDPMARSKCITLFKDIVKQGKSILISSHILHEVDLLSDKVIVMKYGSIMADGKIQNIREDMEEKPLKMLLHCDNPHSCASILMAEAHILEVKIIPQKKALLVGTTDVKRFYKQVESLVIDQRVELNSMSAADKNIDALYDYLIESDYRYE